MAQFRTPNAPALPKIACIGTIAEIGDTKVSQSGAYNVTKIVVEPRGGGYKTTFSLLTRPEWLTPNFNPDVELEGNKSATFVYSKNIQGPKGAGLAIIQGLAGSEEGAGKLVDSIFSAVKVEKDKDTGVDVAFVPDSALDAILKQYVGTTIGYVLGQKAEDTGEVDEAGKKLKIRTNTYELSDLFFPTEAALKKYRKLATERPDDWRVGFDDAF